MSKEAELLGRQRERRGGVPCSRAELVVWEKGHGRPVEHVCEGSAQALVTEPADLAESSANV
jgi:hypothetical protein